jgi:hypothetical protein
MERLGVDSLFYSDLRIRALAERERIPVVTLAIPMAEYALTHKIALHGFPGSFINAGHWNESGHRLAGEILAASICRAGALARAGSPDPAEPTRGSARGPGGPPYKTMRH